MQGFISQWWPEAEDNRPEEPYVDEQRWTRELVAAGFTEPEAFVRDGVDGFHTNAGIIASIAVEESRCPTKVTLLCHNTNGAFEEEMKSTLRRKGIEVDVCLLGQPLPPQQDVISLLEVQEPLVYKFSEESFQTIIQHLNELQGQMLWVTRPSQIGCTDPNYAMTLGFLRTARNELSAKLYTVEIDDTSTAGATATTTESLADILLWTRSAKAESDSMDPDWEFAIVKGQVLVPRFHWQQMSTALQQSSLRSSPQHESSAVKELTVKTPGLLHTMGWMQGQAKRLGPSQVMVETKAVGLNFRVSYTRPLTISLCC